MKRIILVLCILVMLCLLPACTIIEEFCHELAFTNDNPQLTMVPQSEMPGYLVSTSPWPGGTFSLSDYQKMAKVWEYMGTEPGVCINIGPIIFMEPGDFYSAEDWIKLMVSVDVDGTKLDGPNTITLTDSGGAKKYNSETGELEWKEPDGSPIAACYSVMLDAGLHNATLEVRTTSGKVTSYSWAFVLTKE